MRFEGTSYRAHDPRWAFSPLCGDGVAIRGARFNPKGMPALYLALDIMTAVKEANQGLAYKIEIFEAVDRQRGFEVSTPRIPGLRYRDLDEIDQEAWRG